MDDLCVRFIINLPQEDLSSVARICFQVEEAQWFYEDFIRPLDPTLPSMSLRTFCLRIFKHCPLLASFSVGEHTKAFEEFLEYKTRVPVRGAIMLNHDMDSVVLVKGWKKGASWSFPRGKINKDEDDLDCALREVYEETGLDLRAAGLVPTDRKPKYIEIAMREQQLRLYVFRDIPVETDFQPRTRKEISKIQWYKLSELPSFRKKGAQGNHDSGAGSNATSKFYMVAPFLVPLKKWIASQKKADERKAAGGPHSQVHQQLTAEEAAATEDDAPAPCREGAPSQCPAIETLDGATRELQRLLKMQSPSQRLQPSQSLHEDKGSALLSLLQAGHSEHWAAAQASGTNVQQASQNVQLPGTPPSFYASSRKADASGGAVQQQHMGASHGAQHGTTGQATWHYYPVSQQIPLAHPQPFSPQVQRTVLDQRAFQEGPPGEQSRIARAQQQQEPTRHAQDQTVPAAQAARGPGRAQLSGKSMALLNAFKRDTASPGPATRVHENANGFESRGTAGQAVGEPPRAVFSAPQGLPNLLESSGTRATDQKRPLELDGSAVEVPTAQHRSALLGMFKRTDVANGPATATDAGKAGKTPQKPPQQRGTGPQNPPPSHLTLNHQPEQHEMAATERWDKAATHQRHGAAEGAPSGAPIRILQRGQVLGEDEGVGLSMLSPYGMSSQGRKANVSSAQSTVRRGGQGPTEQKRQLLSLFSKQQGPSARAGGGGDPGCRAASRASVGGEQVRAGRRAAETTISPADQTFLLEYLQTVTQEASKDMAAM